MRIIPNVIFLTKIESKLSFFSQILLKPQNFRALRALQTSPQYCSYYQYLPIATFGEAQQQKLKAVFKLPGKRLAF
ncbi:hypothetical protein HOLleu_19173 [Holothuria leucospilota]|uniref:Uncharacterized protein n=1 Tax=Holothuria leucospilota TaxID=206669 RepID=A0A9Q1C3V9_HOLLE|nr:hypothetical protein HOLleu_19173 [Holothuria leucospilota]